MTFEVLRKNFNLLHIRAYLQAKWRILFLPKHIKEQIELRKVLAKKCVNLGKCEFCGCDMVGEGSKLYSDMACTKFYSQDPTIAAQACYGEMLNKEDWKKFKTNDNSR